MESTIRPLGGIAALTLGVASLREVALTLSDHGVSIPLLEDRSSYSESREFVGATQEVKHTLKIVTALEYELPEELRDGLREGFTAHLRFNSRREICVGWSQEASSDRALRLVSCSSESGEKPSSRGYKEWRFESTDGAQKI